MAKLTEEQKTFIVQQLACFDSPSQVAAAFFEEFGVKIERMQVAQYNPERAAAKTVHEKWKAIFYATREAFLEASSRVPIAQQSYRLRSLQRLHDLAVERKNAALAAQLLEQAAKEVGGAFTNTRQLQGPGGGPIPVQHSGKVEHLHKMSDEDLERIARGESIDPAASGGA
jgi:hypothetical protein